MLLLTSTDKNQEHYVSASGLDPDQCRYSDSTDIGLNSLQMLSTDNKILRQQETSYTCVSANSEARTLKMLRTSKGDYWIKQ